MRRKSLHVKGFHLSSTDIKEVEILGHLPDQILVKMNGLIMFGITNHQKGNIPCPCSFFLLGIHIRGHKGRKKTVMTKRAGAY